MRLLLRRVFVAAGLAVSLSVGPVATAAAGMGSIPSFDEVRAAHRPSDIPLLDRHGVAVQWQRIDPLVRRGPWVALADVSPALREAIVLSEDRRFWEHGGVDWHALAASAWANAWNTRTRGASTVTMQLAGLVDEDLARPAGGRDVAAKLGQMVRARQLEAAWSKAQILEAYLNAVPLRGELVGVAAASQQLFGKHPSGLDLQEAAVLAVLVRGPNAPVATVSRRACEVLHLQARQRLGGAAAAVDGSSAKVSAEASACAGVETLTAQALARRPGPMLGEALAPHLGRLMWREAGSAARAAASAPSAQPLPQLPGELRSTLDAQVQRFALAALRRQLAELRGRNVEDGALVVLDNASGEVLAWVGSTGAGPGAPEVDAVLARRQPGSTIKPFLYALALERRVVTAASLLEDSPVALPAGASGLYTPRNYDHAYRGGVTVREALAASLNVPAVRVAAMLGPEALFDRLTAAGLKPAFSAGHHGLALALGSADVTLLDLSNAYRMLAAGGRLSPVRWRAGAVSGPGASAAASTQVYTPQAAWLVSHILADPAARAAGFGLDSPLVTRGHAAVKTGTSKDMRDNWCVGSTDRFTIGVWVGNAGGQPMHGVSGVSGAAPVWREVAMFLHALPPSPGMSAQAARSPAPPAGLVAVDGEWFIAGTEPAAGSSSTRAGAMHASSSTARPVATRAAAFGIESPRDGTIVALDPEIPLARQRLVLRGAPGQWWLDGRPLGRGSRIEWLPQPGRHVLEWRDTAAGAAGAIERIEFEVRAVPAWGVRPTGAAAPARAATPPGRG